MGHGRYSRYSLLEYSIFLRVEMSSFNGNLSLLKRPKLTIKIKFKPCFETLNNKLST